MKIAVVANYFGAPPPYFQLWLDSCAFNPQIDWLFYTDISAAEFNIPDNVTFKTGTLNSLKAKIQAKIPYPIRYEKAWDFCALKPILGYVFEPELKGYDFWGWCDCDMVYGDLTPCVMACDNHDKVMPKGHLSFIRNSTHINKFLAEHTLTHKAISIDECGLPCYDEVGVPEVILPELGARQHNGIPFVNTACRPGHFVLDDVAALQSKLGLEGNGSLPFIATWHNGKMVCHFALPTREVRRIEIAYFHFFRREMCPVAERLTSGHHYLIVPNEIREYDGHELSYGEIRHLDRFRIHWQYWRNRVNKKLGHLNVFR